jgi:hypothetical protein
MRLLRSRLTRQPCSLCEVRSQYADKVRKTIEISKKEPPALSKPLRIVRPLVMMWASKRIRVCAARRANPSRGGGAKPKGLLEQLGGSRAVEQQQRWGNNAPPLGEVVRMQPTSSNIFHMSFAFHPASLTARTGHARGR